MKTAPYIRLVLWKTAKAVERVDRESIDGTGLQLSEFAILEALLHKGPLTISAIGEKVLLTSGSMTAAINRLQTKGLVKRVQDPSDGRYFHVHLTPSGKTIIEAAFETHRQNLEAVAATLTQQERREFVRLLKKLGRNAEIVTFAQ